MIEFYRWSFPRLTAVLYACGALLHVLRVLKAFPVTAAPFFIDWLIAALALYGGLGFLLNFREFGGSTSWRRVITGIMVVHLLISAILHVYIIATRSHAVLGLFPVAYSVGAIFVFLGFASVAATSRLPAVEPS
jgi:hypothetical protein